MGTILGRGTLAFDTKLGPPLAPPRGPSAEALRKPRRAVFARQFRLSKVRQLRSFEATQPTGKTQGKRLVRDPRGTVRCAFRIVVVW